MPCQALTFFLSYLSGFWFLPLVFYFLLQYNFTYLVKKKLQKGVGEISMVQRNLLLS